MDSVTFSTNGSGSLFDGVTTLDLWNPDGGDQLRLESRCEWIVQGNDPFSAMTSISNQFGWEDEG